LRCWSKYLAVGGAGLAGIGSAASIVVGAGVLSVPALIATMGSLMLLICALKDLAECLRRKGRDEDAARLTKRIEELEREVQIIKSLLSSPAS
jgi:hypothetical protein